VLTILVGEKRRSASKPLFV